MGEDGPLEDKNSKGVLREDRYSRRPAVVGRRKEDHSSKEEIQRAKFYLTVEKKPYSPAERMLFDFLPKDGRKITSTKLVDMRKKKKNDWEVGSARRVVTVTMQHLIRKIKINREEFEIKSSSRRGPYAMEYWLEPR